MKFLTSALLLLLLTLASFAQDSTQTVVKFNIKENIAPAVWQQTQKAFDLAQEENADLILIHMNTYGGTVIDADSIRTKILNSSIPVYVFIDNNAASAGALISVACDSIFMRKGGSIGAATVVNQTGEAAPDKYQSYFRSIMRATAESHGKDTIIEQGDTIIDWFRNPQIAEAMVDEDLYVEGISDTGKIVTFTPNEAMLYGFCDAIVESTNEILERSDLSDAKIVEYEPTILDIIIGLLSSPMISGLLIMAIIGGIYFEMQSPGIGFPLIIAVAAAVAYFAPLYLEGLAENWEILLFIVGLILIVLEMFVIPGFGVAGIGGIACVITGLVLSLVGNVKFDFSPVDETQFVNAMLLVVVSIAIGFFGSLLLGQKLLTSEHGPFRNLGLKRNLDLEDGFIGTDQNLQTLVGKTGTSTTVLRPSGKVEIDGNFVDAKSETQYIEINTRVIVTRQEAFQVYVEEIDAEEEN